MAETQTDARPRTRQDDVLIDRDRPSDAAKLAKQLFYAALAFVCVTFVLVATIVRAATGNLF